MKYALNILLLFSLFQSSAQNLVPNPSFEDTVNCPIGAAQIGSAVGWGALGGSPDYYNSCDPYFMNVGVPYNWAGYQPASTGEAYIGLGTFFSGGVDREYPYITLTSPLQMGTKYYVSFKTSLSLTTNIQANSASNKLGIKFTTGNSSFNALLDNSAHVYSDSIIIDTLGWYTISGSFIADSNYTTLVVGNFFDDVNTDTIKFFNDMQDLAYYFVDDICVSTDSINCAGNAGINELSKPNKKLIRIIDTMGRETEDKPNTLLIYVYSDGTTEKVYRVK